jgi:PAS domain S-box-containing protein
VRGVTVLAIDVFQHIADVAFVVDAGGLITAATGDGSPYGWTAADVIGRRAFDYLHPDDLAASSATITDMAASPGRHRPVEVRVRRQDGSYASVEVLANNLLHDPAVQGIVMVLRDITERRAAEWARHEREAEYRRIVELSMEGLWTIDAADRTSYVNPRMAGMLGYAPEEMLGRSLFDFTDDDGRAQSERNLQQRRLGVGDKHDFKFLHRDGRAVWTMLAATPLTAADGSYAGCLAVVTDITTRRATEHSLRMSEQRFRLARQYAPTGMAIVGLDGRWLEVNPALCEIVGRDEADLLTLTFQDITHPDDLDDDLDQVRRLLAGETRSYEMEKRYLRPDGTVVWVRLIASLARDDDGRPLYYLAQVLDLTEQRRSQQLLTWMFERSPDLMCITDLDGRFLSVNPSWTTLLGWSEGELLARPLDQFVHPDDRDAAAEVALVGDGRAGSWRFENRYRTKDDDYRWLQWNSLTLPDEGIVVANARDITAQRWQQTELERQRVELARSNEELEHFAYVASHDLREPLRTISGFAHLLEQDYGGSLDDTGREYLHFLRDGTARMQRMIADLLAYSRVGHEPVRDVLALDDVVAVVLLGLQPSISESGATVSVGPLPVVCANRTQMEVLVQNLVANALKFHRPDAGPRVAISGSEHEGVCHLVVDDAGIGIPEAYRDRVFKMFQRLHSQEQYPGTGLGLAMCKKIAYANDGEIGVEDSPAGGTRFVVRLPAAGAGRAGAPG